MNKKISIALLLFAGFTSSASAGLINASDYFNSLITAGNTAQQSTNTWQLGYVDIGGAFTLYGYTSSGIVAGSTASGAFDGYSTGLYNGFGVNVSSMAAPYFGQPIAANELYVHPDGTRNMVLRFYAATNAVFDFDTTIRNAHFGAVGTSVAQNGALLSSVSIQNNSSVFMQQLSLNAGDTVDFSVNIGAGSNGGDGTAINANVGRATVTVSEPGTLAILGLSLLAFARIRRKG